MKKTQSFVKFIESAFSIIEENTDEIPVGCAIINNKTKEIITATNEINKAKNILAHAEILAIKKANKKFKEKGNLYLTNCDIYITLEPCYMCSYAILKSRFRRVYFGAYNKKEGAIEELSHKAKLYKPEIYGGIEEKRSKELLDIFFKNRRKN